MAVFRKVNEHILASYHDALEFADGTIVPLTRLCLGQQATVLQLPAAVQDVNEIFRREPEAISSA
jgi:hypothetical protein